MTNVAWYHLGAETGPSALSVGLVGIRLDSFEKILEMMDPIAELTNYGQKRTTSVDDWTIARIICQWAREPIVV